jgi:hypothetical protein
MSLPGDLDAVTGCAQEPGGGASLLGKPIGMSNSEQYSCDFALSVGKLTAFRHLPRGYPRPRIAEVASFTANSKKGLKSCPFRVFQADVIAEGAIVDTDSTKRPSERNPWHGICDLLTKLKKGGAAGSITFRPRPRFERRPAEAANRRKLGVKKRNVFGRFARARMDRELRLIRRGRWAVPILPRVIQQ